MQVVSLMMNWYSPGLVERIEVSVAEMLVVMAARRESFGARAAARAPEAPAARGRVAGAREAGHLLPALRGAEGAAGADDAELAALLADLHRAAARALRRRLRARTPRPSR